MGIVRSRLHKRKITGGKTKIHRKRMKAELGRLPANTKLGPRRVSPVRARGGNFKLRGLRLDTGNFAWSTEASAQRARILDVVYNATSNELVRTKTLVKNCIVVVDAAPFRVWYAKHYGIDLGASKSKKTAQKSAQKKSKKSAHTTVEKYDVKKASSALKRKWAYRRKHHKIEKALADQLREGRLLARITSRPGQTGRADGALLEGAELQFYLKKLDKKKRVGAMGIVRSRLHKRKITGGKTKIHRKRMKAELGRLPANTKLGPRRVSPVRARGGNFKLRGLRLDTGNFAWSTEASAQRARILDVVYNATSNELVRTKTLVKNCIVVVDAAPFRVWYAKHYGIDLGASKSKKTAQKSAQKKSKKSAHTTVEKYDVKKASSALKRKWAYRRKHHKIEKALADQLREGRLLARITSRPGQTGRADGALLEGAELQFYLKKLDKKKR